MTRIYKVKPSDEKAENLWWAGEEEQPYEGSLEMKFGQGRVGGPGSWVDVWPNPPLVFYRDPEALYAGPERVDIPMAHWSHLVPRPSAVAVLGDVLSVFGELLPVQNDEDELQYFHCMRVVDAVDLERSHVMGYHSDGEPILVQRKFRDGCIGDNLIFHASDNLSVLYVQQGFVDLYEQAGLTGVRFDFRDDVEL